MKAQFRNKNFYLMVSGDAILFAFSVCLAYLARFEFTPEFFFLAQMFTVLPLFVLIKSGIYFLFGQYRGMWRYTSFYELLNLGKAAGAASLVLVAVILYVRGFSDFPRSIFLIDCLLTIFLTTGLRLGIRRYFEAGSLRGFGADLLHLVRKPRQGKRIIILGAGLAGEQILREMLKQNLGYLPVGFLDDNPARWGRLIHGTPVLGEISKLADFARQENAEEVLIARPSATGDEMRTMMEQCEQAGLRYRTLPSLGELIDGKVSVKALRDVNLQDLLGREQVDLETERISGYITDKVVMVTGCGGSIGSELCRQIIRFAPKLLILFDSSEFNLYSIQMELHHGHGFENYLTVLGQLQDQKLLEKTFTEHKPQVVFHAAAYKHVPLLEKNPWEAVTNNIVASRAVMRTAVRHKVERFVLVSTDKAVRPTNVMGTSKRVTEIILQSLIGGPTKFMAVRFGNVIGSSGSVIPLFLEQIRRGGPVTVTHPEVTRYFMTIPEASQLILQAGAMGGQGELFLLKMGQPVKIADMARDLIRLSGKDPDRDITIKFTGLRDGEKLYEELITEGEDVVETTHGKIMELRADGPWYGHATRAELESWLDARIDELLALARDFNNRGIKKKLVEMVPEYTPEENTSIFKC
ncbi:MAG: polysaccharide biosynthesis protein [Desulfovibrio sp.]|uniref:polysaccharide biosynthesis protein n=1 Tax=Desulfovibrio sp. 7SRBS1 TaxID=3378064 RepID=UPI003B3E57FA